MITLRTVGFRWLAAAAASLSAFSYRAQADWESEANARIEQFRKGNFTVKLVDARGHPLPGVRLEMVQTRPDFKFGYACVWDKADQDLLSWVRNRFSITTEENNMKWTAQENVRGVSDFPRGDAAVRIARHYDLWLRGHTLVWGKDWRPGWNSNPEWVMNLTGAELQTSVDARIRAAGEHYRGDVLCWDVNNEEYSGHWFQQRLGVSAEANMMKKLHTVDPVAIPFVNAYDVLDNDQQTANFCQYLKRLTGQGVPPFGIGIQSHNIESLGTGDMKALLGRLDQIARRGGQIQLTEMSCRDNPDALRNFLRLGFSHPAVDAMILWSGHKKHWLGGKGLLVDTNGHNTAQGDVLDRMLLTEWRTQTTSTTDKSGQASFRGFYGTYAIRRAGREIVRTRLTRENEAVDLKILGENHPGEFTCSATAFALGSNHLYTVVSVVRQGGSQGRVTVNCTMNLNGAVKQAVDGIAPPNELLWVDGEAGEKRVVLAIPVHDPEATAPTVRLKLNGPPGACLGSSTNTVLWMKPLTGKAR